MAIIKYLNFSFLKSMFIHLFASQSIRHVPHQDLERKRERSFHLQIDRRIMAGPKCCQDLLPSQIYWQGAGKKKARKLDLQPAC